MLGRIIISSVILFLLWLLLSGHFNSLLLSLGVLSCIFVAWLALKLELLNPKSDTLWLTLKLPIFLPWFFVEVVKSNLEVSWRILHPKLPISPTISTVPITQHNEVGKAVYANCITLTPGTYSLDINSDVIEVHSLTTKLADELGHGEMGKRILALQNKHIERENS